MSGGNLKSAKVAQGALQRAPLATRVPMKYYIIHTMMLPEQEVLLQATKSILSACKRHQAFRSDLSCVLSL